MVERAAKASPQGRVRGRTMVRVAQRVLSGAAAVVLAAFTVQPALAQTAGPGPQRQPTECIDGARDCAPPDEAGAPSGGAAVTLPDLIVDLFPNPPSAAGGATPGGLPMPTPDPRRPADAALPPAAGVAAGSLAGGSGQPPSGPIIAPTDLPLAEPLRAIAGDFVPDEVLVTVSGDPDVVQQLAISFGLQVRSQRQSRLLGATLVRYGIPDGRPVAVVLAQLAADGRAERREPNHVYALQQAAIVNYSFERIALDAGAANGEDVRVAVIDTAADDTHPALQGVIAEQFDALPDTPVQSRDHGTSIDGLLAGTGPFQGVAPGAALYHARAFEDGKSSAEAILASLDWAAEKDVRIVNMSFVGPKNELLGTACRNARALGMVLVAAAGNNGPKAPYGYPAAFEGVVAVTATDAKDGLMAQANRGSYVYISAPGVDMAAPIGGGSDLVTGTSFAAAIVSGAIANLFHAKPDLSADQAEKALADTATDLGAAGRDNDFGFGLLNLKAAAARE
ncbi:MULTISPECIES: S8 family serine peptidase [unclassified Mesorhizobium]|uniref:S8 family serine peptidase n=2 Tax=unclassified Mesorhizobium TaxID=325217 RepID=UPI000AEE8FD7|nr:MULTISPECIES: S8 family serine peptidase [unclassified Mesorhizobium]